MCVSLSVYIDELKIAMSDCIPDILCVNETRLDKSISDNIIKIHGYIYVSEKTEIETEAVYPFISEKLLTFEVDLS